MYISVPRLWPGSTIVCIASGPSLTQEDVDYCRGRAKVITVNESILMAPWADVAYAHHASEWERWQGLPAFKGLKYCYELAAEKWGVQVVKGTAATGLDVDPSGISHGYTSSYQVMNIGVHLGAKRLILLGYDICAGENGEAHWHAGISPGDRDVADLPFTAWLKSFPTLVEPLRAIGVDVVNCSRRTALTCFPVASLRETLQ